MGPAEPIHRGWRIGRQHLVVLSLLIIPLVAILAAILFPAFVRVEAKKAQRACLANLRMLHSAAMPYAEDNDGYLPRGVSWRDALLPHLPGGRDCSLCPATKKPYVFNDALSGSTIKKMPSPDKVTLFSDAPADERKPPHGGGFNVVFLDGHVQWLDEARFHELMTGER